MKLKKLLFLGTPLILAGTTTLTSCNVDWAFDIEGFDKLKGVTLTVEQREIVFKIKPIVAFDSFKFELKISDSQIASLESTKENEWKITAKLTGKTSLEVKMIYSSKEKQFTVTKNFSVSVNLN